MVNGTVNPNSLGAKLAFLTCSMLILMGGAAVTPGLPGLESHFAGNDDLISFIITLPHLAVAIVGLFMGILVDRFGRVNMLLLSLTIFIVTGTGSYFLDDIYQILMLRFLLGFGLAGIVCTVTSLIGAYYHGAQRVRMLGLQSAAMGIGVLILEVVGGALADMSWNAPFLVYLIAVPFALLVLIFVREPVPGSYELGNDPVIEDKNQTDMKKITACYLSIVIGMIIIFVIPTKMPGYMEGLLGVSATMMGLYLGFHGLGNALFSALHKTISDVLTRMQMISLAFVLLAISLALPMFVAETVPVCIVTLIVSGFAVGLLVPSVVNSIVDASSVTNCGKMMGLYAMFLLFGIRRKSTA